MPPSCGTRYPQETNFVGMDTATMCFELAGQTSGPDPGAEVIGRIFQDTTVVSSDVLPTTHVQVHASAGPAEAMALGQKNTSENLRLVDPANGDSRLCPGSPARDIKTPITLTDFANGSIVHGRGAPPATPSWTMCSTPATSSSPSRQEPMSGAVVCERK